MQLAALDANTLLIAAIAAVPATIAALASLRNGRALRTPSKTSIGRQVEDALHTAIANNYRLQAMGDEFDVPMPDKASASESRVEALNEVKTRAERRPRG
jgi:hypothetical protein